MTVLNRLTAEQREAVVAVYFDGKTQAQAALELGVSQPAISQRVTLARRTLESLGLPKLQRRRLATSKHMRPLPPRIAMGL